MQSDINPYKNPIIIEPIYPSVVLLGEIFERNSILDLPNNFPTKYPEESTTKTWDRTNKKMIFQ